MAFIAANIIYGNGHRPGVVQRMTTKEFEDCEEEDGDLVVQVFEHKTSGSFGPANVVIEPNIYNLMAEYFTTIRTKIEPKCKQFSERFFLTNTGFEFRNISETMQEVAKLFGIELPNATIHRKWIDTNAYATVDDKTMRVLNKHMAHSSTTSTKFYQFQSTQNAVDTHKEIKKLTVKNHFTKKEDKVIIQEYSISQDVTPSLAICQEICDKYGLQKSKKQIQDRWRSMKKRH